MKRTFTLNELVFDAKSFRYGRISGMVENDGTALYELTTANGWNKHYLDLDDDSEPAIWWVEDETDLYKIADGKEGRDGCPVCIEHNKTQDDYPFYSPTLDENLFSFEVFAA